MFAVIYMYVNVNIAKFPIIYFLERRVGVKSLGDISEQLISQEASRIRICQGQPAKDRSGLLPENFDI